MIRAEEITKWEKEKEKTKGNHYFAYMVFVITLIYMTDEIASQIGTLMKTEIAGELLANFGESSVGVLDTLGMAVLGFILALITLSAKTHDTKGLDLDTVTGCEWD